MCPRCLDKESRGETDVQPFELNGTMGMYKTEELAVMERDMLNGWPGTVGYIEPAREYVDEEEIKSRINELPKVGVKHDQEKPDLSLLPREFLEEVSKAFMHGEKKYGRYNYRNGMDWHRLVAAALRHITAFNEGEDKDTESGFSHLGHAGACIAMLVVYQTLALGKDTRYKP